MPLFTLPSFLDSDDNGCKWGNHVEMGTMQTAVLLHVLFVYIDHM